MRRQKGRRSWLSVLGLVGLLAVGASRAAQAADEATPAAGEPALVEKMLSPDSVAVIVLRNPDVTSARWKETALFELLQEPEMQAMLAPLKQSILKLYGALPPAVTKTDLSGLLPCESALAAVVLPQSETGAQLMLQLILHPADPAKGQAVIKALFDWLVESQTATRAAGPENAEMLNFEDKTFLLYSFNEGAMVLTLNDKDIPEFRKLHAETVARRTAGAGLSADPEYALGRSRVGPAPEAWLYFGLFSWLAKHPEVGAMVAPFLATAGLDRVQGCTLGATIEDRGFRTRLFVHVAPAAEPAPPAGKPEPPALIGPDQLALVPRDVLFFSIGSADWKGAYNKLTQLIAMAPPPYSTGVAAGIGQVEALTGMNLRDDLIGQLSGPYVTYATEPGSQKTAAGANVFLKVRDPAAAAANLEKLLNAVSRLIRQQLGPDADAFVQIRRLDRPHVTQIYPQSILPGLFTPNFVISDAAWASMDLSARSALAKIQYFMDHRENVSARPDFAKILAKMPQGYTRISYTDVGACFSNGLACAQFLTDLPVMLLKISAKSDETFKFPIALNEFWGMDPGRFPPEALMREKLFGAVAVTVPQPDGWLYENFSPIGPIPLPTAPTGFQNQVATMSILAGMLLPALARAREAARAASCKANLAQIAKALVAYEMAHNQNMPSSLADLLPQYLAQPRVLICPNDQAPMVIRNGMKCSYRYIGNVPEKDSWSDLFIVYDHAVDEGGRNVVHYDGFISFYSEEEFHRTLAEQYEKFKPILARPDFPGDRDRVKAFFEDKDFPEK